MEEPSGSNLVFITGGARSGKSALAESLAVESGLPVHYLATMPHWPGDAEVADRVRRHRVRRPASWTTIESPRQLDVTVRGLPAGPLLAVIDCLSLYVSTLLLDGYEEGQDPYAREGEVMSGVDSVIEAITARRDVEFITVTNEVGWGVVPDTPLGRAYRDFLGLANQSLAQRAAAVWLLCSGLKIRLK